MRKNVWYVLAVLAMLTMVAACKGSGGDGGGGGDTVTPVVTDLKSVFYRKLTNAPVATINLKRQDGTAIVGATITADTRELATGNRLAGSKSSKTTDANGTVSTAIPAGTYPIVITQASTTAGVGNFNDTITVTSDKIYNYTTSQQSWIVNSTKSFKKLEISIYQTDASGNLNRGTLLQSLNPLILSTSVTYTAGATTSQFTTELFKGTYRAVIKATPLNSTESIKPYITPASPVITASGNAGTDTVPTVDLDAVAGNVLSLTLSDTNGPISSATASYSVYVYDRTSLLTIGSASTNTLGVAAISTGDITDVVAVVRDSTSNNVAIKAFTASTTSNEKWRRYQVTGSVKPPTGGTLDSTDTTMLVIAEINSGLGDYFDKTLASSVAASVNSLGSIQNLNLFEGTYSLSASIKSFPDSDNVALTIGSTAPADQTINVRAGGVITGRIQDQSKKDITGVYLYVTDATTNDFVTSTTSTTLGSYTLSVPLGTYNLYANGAVTRNLAVTTSTVTKNLTQFTVQGRITDSLDGGLAGTVTYSGYSSSSSNKTADSLGMYTINMMEGENWVLFTPPSTQPSLGYALEPAVQIDATTILSN